MIWHPASFSRSAQQPVAADGAKRRRVVQDVRGKHGSEGDYVKAAQRVYHAPGQASLIELPMVGK